MTELASWVAYAREMECSRCGNGIFCDDDDAREAAEALIDGGFTEPPTLHEYYSFCDYCDHVLDKDED